MIVWGCFGLTCFAYFLSTLSLLSLDIKSHIVCLVFQIFFCLNIFAVWLTQSVSAPHSNYIRRESEKIYLKSKLMPFTILILFLHFTSSSPRENEKKIIMLLTPPPPVDTTKRKVPTITTMANSFFLLYHHFFLNI